MRLLRPGKSFYPLLIIAFSLLGLIIVGCEFEEPTSIWDLPDDPDATTTPVVTNVEPADWNMAGIGVMRIIGSNFSATADSNVVFFNDTRAEIVSASNAVITIKTPLLVGDSLKIKVARLGAYLFSSPVYYRILPSVVSYGTLLASELPAAITVDSDENVYVSLQSNILRKIAPDGILEDYDATFFQSDGMKVGPGGLVYATWNLRKRGRVSYFDTTGVQTDWVAFGKEAYDLDFDQDSSLWVALATDLVRVKPDGSQSTMDTYSYDLSSVRIYDGYVYVMETDASTGAQKLWRSAIQGDGSLGTKQLVLDFSSIDKFTGVTINCFTFSSSGDIYFATDAATSALIVYYAAEDIFEYFYPGLIKPPITYFGWGTDSYLYASKPTTGAPQILKIDVRLERVKQYSAPYYGR
ncbi:MAG: IPT/TIG domain-containing protein [Candidatus Neomarinimicrobiota bacterium]